MTASLEAAWNFREEGGWLKRAGALRVFHGPREGDGALARYAIDQFASDRYWVTEWEGNAGSESSTADRDHALGLIREFLTKKGAKGAVFLPRPERGLAPVTTLLFGEIPQEALTVHEGTLRFRVRLLGVRHPGLFLDHRPLREWLRANLADRTVLNAFAYTGSLSVAAGVGGASLVTTLDLSKPSIQWAEENWKLNELPDSRARFLADDVFDRLPRFEKRGERFDCVILDPPSFSRGKKGGFSTARDLVKLHRLALGCVESGGVLVTSINSANVSRAKYEAELRTAAREAGAEFEWLMPISLAEQFRGPRAPARVGAGTRPGAGAGASARPGADEDYLKGWILRVRRSAR